MTFQTLDEIKSWQGDIILPVSTAYKKEKLADYVSKHSGTAYMRAFEHFKGEKGELETFYFHDRCLFVLGLGKNLTYDQVFSTVRSFVFKHKNRFNKEILVDISHRKDETTLLSEAITAGFMQGFYHLGKFKSSSEKSVSFERLVFHSANNKIAMSTSRESAVKTRYQMDMMDLGNAPAHVKTPEYIADYCRKTSKNLAVTCTVWDENDIKKNKLGCLEAVSRGSEVPPRFVLLEYDGTKDGSPHIGLVGKGITFDTGGISIKQSANMHYMKSDMGGAAGVLGAFFASAELKIPVKLTAALLFSENDVDARSYKPGDIVTSHSGKTIEILNTDAEGRLLLADGLSLLSKKHKPDYLLNMATLTGDTVRTLGFSAASLYCNDNTMAKQLFDCGLETGEKLWQMPLWEEYGKDLSSDVADIKNISPSPVTGAIFAAKFLEYFTNEHPKWAHIDMAGVAFADSEFGKMKNATGFGVQLLTKFFKNLAK